MILESLYELYSRLEKEPEYEVAPFGFSLQQITFRVVIRQQGDLCAIEDLRARERERLRPQLRQVPGATKSPGSGMNPGFLWDNTGYMLGFKPKDENPNRTRKTFEAFRERHLKLEHEITSPRFSAVCRFLEQWSPDRVAEFPVLEEVNPGYGVFQMQGETAYVHEDETIRRWWIGQLEKEKTLPMGQCLVSGKIGRIAETHPKIKRVGDQSESLLVAFNAPSFESYFKTQSLNAPVSEDAAFKYATALNALLAGPMSRRHRFLLADATVVFWTEKATAAEDVLAPFFQYGGEDHRKAEAQDESQLNKLRIFLNALRKGREAYGDLADDAEHTRFYMLGLTGQAKGRLGVRFFHRDTLATILENLRRHYADMRLTPFAGFGKDNRWFAPEFPTVPQILDETAPRRDGKVDRERIPPLLAGPLLRSVISGVRYPDALYEALLRRIQADRQVNYTRCCVIKGCLNRNHGKEIGMSLDTARNEPAYWVGCLFAALEKTQFDALGEVGASIRDRFYGAASATPQSVLPRLLRTYQHHLSKLEGGRKVARERLVRDIMGRLNGFPPHLNLADQGLFALGYYHQMATLWTAKEKQDNTQPTEEN